MIGNTIVAIARRFNFVRETEGPNRGLWVHFILWFTGNEEGASWCMAFVSLVLFIAYRGHPPIVRTSVCQVALDDCRRKHYIVEVPRAGDLVFTVNSVGHAHHVAIATGGIIEVELPVIAGNTSEDGNSDNGTGVFEHPVKSEGKVYARLPEAA
jgi:hypothetical protein